MFRAASGALVTAILCATSMTAHAESVTLTSSDFYLAYGATVTGDNAWTTTETSSVNSPTTQGSFLFSAAPTGKSFSGNGPTFANGELATSGSASVSGWLAPAAGFAVPITAQYTGTAPSDASSTPNYQLKLEITSLRIWASDSVVEYSTAEGCMAWSETTAGHAYQTGWTTTKLTKVAGNYGDKDNFSQIVYDPDDYSVALESLNDSYTRTFSVPSATGGIDYRHGDGLEVVGRVHLVYDAIAVPEPSTALLMTSALIGLLAYAWRRRR